MTELLRQAIAQIERLPAEQQDAIASRFLAELQDDQLSGAENFSESQMRLQIERTNYLETL